jgi:hypothetical protein
MLEKPEPKLWYSRRPQFKPVHERLRIYFDGKPAWKFRGALMRWNKRRKPLSA